MVKINNYVQGEELFVGIDLHKRRWHVNIRTDDVEIFSNSIVGRWDVLRRILDRYKDCRIHSVYEAGYSGFWLFDRLTKYGVDCIVTPPSLIPQEHGNRVKTDRRDSRKLARLLAKGLLKSIWVPSPEERFHRQVIRRRRQLVGDRVRTQNRIKMEILLELQDLSRFRRAEQLAAYVGLTPSQYSSADKIRMGYHRCR
jgi:transposase